MGHINLKDHALINRWWENEKMNVTIRCLRKKNGITIENDLCLLLEVVCIFEVLEFTTI
jgi:hypothetical protein